MTGYPSEPRIYFDHNASAPLRDEARRSLSSMMTMVMSIPASRSPTCCIASGMSRPHGFLRALIGRR